MFLFFTTIFLLNLNQKVNKWYFSICFKIVFLNLNGFILNNTNGEGFHFKNGSTTIMRMTSSNNVGIGTTSPTQKLDVVISSGPYNTRFHNSSTSTSEYNVVYLTQGASGSATGYFGTGGSAVGGAFATLPKMLDVAIEWFNTHYVYRC